MSLVNDPKTTQQVDKNELDTNLSTREVRKSGMEASKAGHAEKEALKGIRANRPAEVEKKALEEIRVLEGTEKVEDNTRVTAQDQGVERVAKEQQATSYEPLTTPVRRGGDDTAGGKKGGVDKDNKAPDIKAKGAPKVRSGVKVAKVLGAVDPKVAREQQKDLDKAIKEERVDKQRRVEESRNIAAEESFEKDQDRQQQYQNRRANITGGTTRVHSLGVSADGLYEETGNESESDAASTNDTGGLNTDLQSSGDYDSPGVSQVQSGAILAGRSESDNSVSTGAEDFSLQQQMDLQSDSARRQAEEDERLEAELEAELLQMQMEHEENLLDVDSGISGMIAEEIHRDVRDIKILLLMAKAHLSLKGFIAEDVLAANTSSDGAPSFQSCNIEAVQVASQRFHDQVREVLPWQRFGAS
jgi:hypothetical protein